MPAKSREIGTAALVGLVVGGIISAILGVVDLPFASSVGAFIGGIVAAYLLYGKVGQAAVAGGISGIVSYPFSLGVVLIMFIFQLYTPPSGPSPPTSVLEAGVALEAFLNFVSGAVGGLLLSSVRHPAPGAGLPPPPPPPGYVPGQVRYCVQCGAQVPAGTVICPHCNARQPTV